MDKESVLQKSREENKDGDEYVIQKRTHAERSSLLIVSSGFLVLCTCEVFGIITGKNIARKSPGLDFNLTDTL